MKEEKSFLEKQEQLYWESDFLFSQWYRKLYGGEWRLLKFGHDTPMIRLFATWTKMGDECFDNFIVLEKESHPITHADTRWKLFKQLIKNIFKK